MTRMEDLPDAVLISIVALLPLKEAGRTSAISKRFSKFWTFVSRVVIDDMHEIIKQCSWCRANRYQISLNCADCYTFDDWIEWLTKQLNCVEELTLVWKREPEPEPDYQRTSSGNIAHFRLQCGAANRLKKPNLSSSVRSRITGFQRFGHNLKKLELKGLQASEIDINSPSLEILVLEGVSWLAYRRMVIRTPNLKVFQAHHVVHLREEEIDQIIRSSNLLTDITIEACCRINKVEIWSQKLKVLKILRMMLTKFEICAKDLSVLVLEEVSCPVKNMSIDTPNLVEFRSYSKQDIENIFGYLKPIDILERYTSFLESQYEKFCPITLENLQTLSVNLDLNNITEANVLLKMLRFCTRLENLDITIQEEEKEVIPDKRIAYKFWHKQISSSSSYNLRNVKIQGYRTQDSEYEFFKHLITKSNILEKISIQFYDKSSQDATFADTGHLLLIPTRASLNASIILVSYCKRYKVVTSSYASLLN